MAGISLATMPAAISTAQISSVSDATQHSSAQLTSDQMNIDSNITNSSVSSQQPVQVSSKPQQLTANQIAADHGRYLREMAGIASDTKTDEVTVEITTKRKPGSKKRKADGDGPSTKASSKKRKASDSSETGADAGEKHDAKTSTMKRKSSTSTDTSTDAWEKNNSLSPDETGNFADSVESKMSKPPAKKASSKKRVAAAKESRLPEVVMQTKPELSFVVSSKLGQVHRYVVASKEPVGFWLRSHYGLIEPAAQPTLQRVPPTTRIVLPELAILGTLMRIMLDYELPIPISLDTVRDMIIDDSVEAPAFCTKERAEGIRTSGTRWITLDLNRACSLDDDLREKIDDRGPDVRSWFETELEMYKRQLWRSALQPEATATVEGGVSQDLGDEVQRK